MSTGYEVKHQIGIFGDVYKEDLFGPFFLEGFLFSTYGMGVDELGEWELTIHLDYKYMDGVDFSNLIESVARLSSKGMKIISRNL